MLRKAGIFFEIQAGFWKGIEVAAGEGVIRETKYLLDFGRAMSRSQAQNVSVLGAGGETVVLGHGFGTDQSVWRHIVPHLLDDYRLVLFDLIGSGTTNPELYDFDKYSNLLGYAQDLISLLLDLHIKSCTYVGHCCAGMIGCIASVLRPDLFSKLILLGTTPRFLADVNYPSGFEQPELDLLLDAMTSNYTAWVSGSAPLAVANDIHSFPLREISRTFFSIRPDIALHVVKTIFKSDIRDILPQVTVPCHILQGEKDFACPVVIASYLANHLGGKTTIQFLPTESHLPHLTNPDVVLPVLRAHLALTL